MRELVLLRLDTHAVLHLWFRGIFMFQSLSRIRASVVFAFTLAGVFSVAHAQSDVHQHAHQHGVAKLDVAVEATQITLHLDSPLDNLIGFEHAPRTAAERKLADDAVAKLHSTQMFAIDPAAQCQPTQVELDSAALSLGHPDPHEEEAGHADIDGDFTFTCVDAAKAAFIDVGLFDFARMQKLQVQLATPTGEFQRDLARPERRIVLTK